MVLDNEIRLHLLPMMEFAAGLLETGTPSVVGKRDPMHHLLDFFADRLKVQLREQGARHDLVDAVFALGARSAEGTTGNENVQDDLLLIVRRVEALGKFLDTEDGKNLLAGYKRATNIIRIEEKKDSREYVGRPDSSLYRQREERALANASEAANAGGSGWGVREAFEGAMLGQVS